MRRRYEQKGIVFYTDNDSEVIGVYLRDRMLAGPTLAEAMEDSLADLDGAYNYLVVSSEGLGIVRDRFGFKPLVLAETDSFVAVATEEIALRRAIPGDYFACEPSPGSALFIRSPRGQNYWFKAQIHDDPRFHSSHGHNRLRRSAGPRRSTRRSARPLTRERPEVRLLRPARAA